MIANENLNQYEKTEFVFEKKRTKELNKKQEQNLTTSKKKNKTSKNKKKE